MAHDSDDAERPPDSRPPEDMPPGGRPAEPNPYGQAPATLTPYGDAATVQNPYVQAYAPAAAPPPGAYPPPSPGYRPTVAYPTGTYPAWAGQPAAGTVPLLGEKKRPTGAWIAGGLTVLLLLVAGIVGISLGSAAHAPELQVSAFLDALRQGNAEEALDLAGEQVDESDLLLTDEAYARADDRITRHAIVRSTVDGNAATVTATISQGGERYNQDFSLTRTGRDAVIFDTWQLDAPTLGFIEVDVTAPPDAVVEVARIDASGARRDGMVRLRALPGTYPVELADDATWYAAEPTTASVLGFGKEPVEAEPLAVALTDDGTQAARDAVDDWLDACIASKELDPAGCPFEASNTRNYEVSNLVWIVSKPTFSIGEFSDGRWAVVTESPGTAQATADAKDPSTGGIGQISTQEFPFDIDGVIEGFTDHGATFVSAE